MASILSEPPVSIPHYQISPGIKQLMDLHIFRQLQDNFTPLPELPILGEKAVSNTLVFVDLLSIKIVSLIKLLNEFRILLISIHFIFCFDSLLLSVLEQNIESPDSFTS